MKKIFYFIIFIALSLSLVGCNKKDSVTPAPTPTPVENSATPLPVDPNAQVISFLDINNAKAEVNPVEVFDSLLGVWFDTAQPPEDNKLSDIPFLQFEYYNDVPSINIGTYNKVFSFSRFSIYGCYEMADGVYHIRTKMSGSSSPTVEVNTEEESNILIFKAADGTMDVVFQTRGLLKTTYKNYGIDPATALSGISENNLVYLSQSPNKKFDLYSSEQNGGGEGWYFMLTARNTKTDEYFEMGEVSGVPENFITVSTFWNNKNQLCVKGYDYKVLDFETKKTTYPIKNLSNDEKNKIRNIEMIYDGNDEQLIALNYDSSKPTPKNGIDTYAAFIEIYSQAGESLKVIPTSVVVYDYKHVAMTGAVLTVDVNANTITLDAKNNEYTKGVFPFSY